MIPLKQNTLNSNCALNICQFVIIYNKPAIFWVFPQFGSAAPNL